MGQFMEDLQYRIKSTSGSLGVMTLKLFVGFMLGLTFALIGQQMVGYGTFSFFLVIVSSMAAFYRIARPWRFAGVLVFALVCVLVGLLLKMYILMAPGA